jgi:hypothetical protein
MDDNILAAVGCVIAVHHDTYLYQLLLLVTPFVAKEDTIMTTHIRSKRLGKSSLKEEILFGFFVSPTHRGLKDAATHVEEFLKAWTVQVEP